MLRNIATLTLLLSIGSFATGAYADDHGSQNTGSGEQGSPGHGDGRPGSVFGCPTGDSYCQHSR